MKIECLLNPGVFRFEGKTWLLLRVAERPEQKPGKTSFPVLDESGGLEILEFDNSDPQLDLSDPRVISYAGQDYLTTMSHLRLVASDDGVHFLEPRPAPPLFGQGELESYGIEDCRVVEIGGTYYLTFTQVSQHGVGVGLRSTRDWRDIRAARHDLPAAQQGLCDLPREDRRPVLRLAPAQQPGTGRQLHLDRRVARTCCTGATTAASPTAARGCGTVPGSARAAPSARRKAGWRSITARRPTPRDIAWGRCSWTSTSPGKCWPDRHEPIMEPIAEYEKVGFFGNVVFTNGHLVDGDEVTIYYGASDSVICGARFSIQEILRTLRVRQGRVS